MTTFTKLSYERPDLDALNSRLSDYSAELQQASTLEEANELIRQINKERNDFETQSQLVAIRHSVDTRDAFYEEEQAFYDDALPVYEKEIQAYYRVLTNHELRTELEAEWGSQLFSLAERALETFEESLIPKLQEENRLATAYQKVMSAAQIEFDGKTLNLSQFGPYLQSPDRDVRKAASVARYTYLSDNGDELDRIYGELVRVRTEIAHALGFPSFVELGYARMQRVGYDESMVDNFRKQVRDVIVPLASALKEKQAKRIGVDHLYYYDESFVFPDGNATPQGDESFIIEGGNKMYRELSNETDEFFQYMQERGALDLTAKPGKSGGGYCTYLPSEGLPFIFSNFNGTAGDIDVLTHEVGHAFQVYESRHLTTPEYAFPTYEACEIHSMSMEFFCWPWMELFFGDQVDKYKFNHLAGSMTFLPYGVLVDEFQHVVYRNPEMTAAERRQAWRDLEKVYLPHRDYETNDYLESGAWWHQQGHIFQSPFYYIDYTLAQVCAFQFWVRMHEDREAAWSDYLTLCQAGGSRSFLELVELAGLKSPFADGVLKETIDQIEDYLLKHPLAN
ncbi:MULTISPECIES: M3 family oligoendopeptidase [unclassified Exiguobacterium]|uniref:M3 family oligoendopeptidase n=1 Tax=unclassified Exiguobacterium TaxID=2644629 RepID=UPI001BED191E|nr:MULTISPECIES: M3 family oligoendopeptidase [unclassified Exiguobacterium]